MASSSAFPAARMSVQLSMVSSNLCRLETTSALYAFPKRTFTSSTTSGNSATTLLSVIEFLQYKRIIILLRCMLSFKSKVVFLLRAVNIPFVHKVGNSLYFAFAASRRSACFQARRSFAFFLDSRFTS